MLRPRATRRAQYALQPFLTQEKRSIREPQYPGTCALGPAPPRQVTGWYGYKLNAAALRDSLGANLAISPSNSKLRGGSAAWRIVTCTAAFSLLFCFFNCATRQPGAVRVGCRRADVLGDQRAGLSMRWSSPFLYQGPDQPPTQALSHCHRAGCSTADGWCRFLECG